MIDISNYYEELRTFPPKPVDRIPPEKVYDYMIQVVNNHSRTTQMIIDVHQEMGDSKDEEYLDKLKKLKEAIMQTRMNISLTKQSLNVIIRTEKFQNMIPPEEERNLEESDLPWQEDKSQLNEGEESDEIIFKDE